nr:hypothetical protein CFP56_67532 [Quercus suber]
MSLPKVCLQGRRGSDGLVVFLKHELKYSFILQRFLKTQKGSIKACRNVALYVKTETSSEHDAKVEDKLQVVPSTKTKAQMVLAEMKRTAQTIT